MNYDIIYGTKRNIEGSRTSSYDYDALYEFDSRFGSVPSSTEIKTDKFKLKQFIGRLNDSEIQFSTLNTRAFANIDHDRYATYNIENAIIIDSGIIVLIEYTIPCDNISHIVECAIDNNFDLITSCCITVLYSNDFLIDDNYKKLMLDISQNIEVCIPDKEDDRPTTVSFILYDAVSDTWRTTDVEIDVGVFDELDLHYGDGFASYYSDLKRTLKNNSKGMVLFHGVPGSGKTYCIKNLIKDLSNEGKQFFYVSSQSIKNIMDPSFLSFFYNESKALNKKNIVLIIEDAEDLLLKRDDYGGNVGNVLNITDGILNDMVKMQIIATVNTTTKLDGALFRSGRLLSTKEFFKLGQDQFNKLSEKLEITDLKYDGTQVIADLYSYKQKCDILYHDFAPHQSASKMNYIL